MSILLTTFFGSPVYSQDVADSTKQEVADSTPVAGTKAPKPVKNTFSGVWLIDNQTVMVPIKGTFEFDIQHRFGSVKNGYKDFYGLFASSNIRFAFNYSPIDHLFVGLGLTKYKMTWDVNAKYAIFQQMNEGWKQVSVSIYSNAAIDTRSDEFFINFSDRLSYFHQLIIARKITPEFSAQIAPSVSHTNVVNGYYSEPGKVSPERNHNHFAIAFSGRYKLTESLSFLINYDQPITKHKSGNPHPNLSFGLESTTSAHAFQLFAGNYYFLSPQQNNMYNTYDLTKGEFLIGFNITRLWNF